MGLRIASDANGYTVDILNTTTAPGSGVDVLGDASDAILAVRASFTVAQDCLLYLQILLSTAGSTVSWVERETLTSTATVGTLAPALATGALGAWTLTAKAGRYYNLRLSDATSVITMLRVMEGR